MKAKKSSRGKSTRPRLASRVLTPFQGAARPFAIGAGLVILTVGAALAAWHRWGPEVSQDPRFAVSAEKINLTPQPDWIHGDVKSDVVLESGLDELSMLDKKLVAKVADAFSLHPWIQEVRGVQKSASAIKVDVHFRRPVALVEVPVNQDVYLVLVDGSGVILPTDKHLLEHVAKYLRITIPDVSSYGPAGTPWSDSRVAAAASIALALQDRWQEAGLYRIAATDESDVRSGQPGRTFELRTAAGARILWGRPPGQEKPGEATSAEKIERLVEYVRQNGPLAASISLDIRDGKATTVVPRAARSTETSSSP